jgi:amidase
MKLQEYAQYDGLGLAELVRKKEITASELMSLAIEAVDKVNPKINAVIEIYEDAFEIAEQSTQIEGVFNGVPFLRKDIGAAESGRLQEMGSRLFKNYRPNYDSYLMEKFKTAGLAVFGRSTVPELGISGATETILQGITRNPWNLDRMAGGSSGGAAASVAAGVVPVAHASDGAGSIRIPAACCGLVGLNPSRGRITLGPNRQDAMFGMVREFVISRTVRDTAAMLDAVHGAGVGDPFVIVKPEQPYLEVMKTSPQNLRIAYTVKPWSRYSVEPEIVKAVEKVVSLCEDMGHHIVEDSPVFDNDKINRVAMNMFAVADMALAEQAEELGRSISPEYLEPGSLKMIEMASRLSLQEAVESFETMRHVRWSVGKFFEDYDLLITPSLSLLPQHHGVYTTKRDDLDPIAFWENDLKVFQYMSLFNVSGTPSISLPLCQSKDGLPIGVQFASGFGREDLLVQSAKEFEQVMPWDKRIPAVHVSH